MPNSSLLLRERGGNQRRYNFVDSIAAPSESYLRARSASREPSITHTIRSHTIAPSGYCARLNSVDREFVVRSIYFIFLNYSFQFIDKIWKIAPFPNLSQCIWTEKENMGSLFEKLLHSSGLGHLKGYEC